MKPMAIVLICAASLTLSCASNAAPVEVRLSAPLGSHAYGQVVISDPSPRYAEYRREVYPRDAYVEPVVIYAPIEHQRHWRRYCHDYGACGQPVRFIEVRESYGRDYDRYERKHKRHHHKHHHHCHH